MASAASASEGIGARLQRKVGPLPVWAWAALILAVGYLVYRRRGGGSSSVGATAPPSQTQPSPVSPDVTGATGGGTDTSGSALGAPPVDLSGITGQLDALSQQLAAATFAAPPDNGGPPGSDNPPPPAAPPHPVATYHPAYHAVAASTPNFGAAARAQSARLGSAAPFGGVASVRTVKGVTTTTYRSGRVVEQRKGSSAYVARR